MPPLELEALTPLKSMETIPLESLQPQPLKCMEPMVLDLESETHLKSLEPTTTLVPLQSQPREELPLVESLVSACAGSRCWPCPSQAWKAPRSASR